MPSLQQLRYEALAHAVERATTPSPFVTLFAEASERLDVRVETLEGRELQLQLIEVDLEAQQLVCRDSVGAQVRVALSSVQAVWQKQRLLHRSLSLWFCSLLAGGAGAAVIVAQAAPRIVVGGVAAGGLVGAVAGIALLKMLDNWDRLYEWKSLYERAAA